MKSHKHLKLQPAVPADDTFISSAQTGGRKSSTSRTHEMRAKKFSNKTGSELKPYEAVVMFYFIITIQASWNRIIF